MVEISALSINGYQGQPVPNLFFRSEGQANTLAVLLPGLRYTCDMPLLYYSARLLQQHGADVLQLKTDYTPQAFQSASSQEQAAWLSADARAAVQAGKAQRDTTRLILVGKSIGTLAMAHLLSSAEGGNAAAIWLTPLLHQPRLVEVARRSKGPVLFACGTGDPTFDQAALNGIREASGAEAIVIEGANHSLEIPGDALRSLQIMEQVMRGIDGFLGRLGL